MIKPENPTAAQQQQQQRMDKIDELIQELQSEKEQLMYDLMNPTPQTSECLPGVASACDYLTDSKQLDAMFQQTHNEEECREDEQEEE
jgi:hypothetical protein